MSRDALVRAVEAAVAASATRPDLLRVMRVWCRDSVVLVYVARGAVQHAYVQGYN